MITRVFLLAMCIAGCAPQAVWVGKDPTRRLHAKVLSDGNGQWVQLIRTEPRVNAVGAEGIVFSADGRRMAYPAQTDDGWTMMLDGVPQGFWDGVAEPAFS